MSQVDNESKQRTARIFRAARKVRSYKQVNLSKELGINQGTISKLENGILAPDAGLWYHFCNILNIDADLTYRSGLIFTSTPIALTSTSFRIPKKSEESEAQVKDCIPFINLIAEQKLTSKFEKHLKQNQIDPDILCVAELKIPINIINLIFDFIDQEVAVKNSLDHASSLFIKDLPMIMKDWSHTPKNPQSSLKRLILDLSKIDNLFNYQIKDNFIQLEFNGQITITDKNKTFLTKYMSYRAQLLKRICIDKLELKNTKIKKSNLFEYAITY